MKTDSELLEKLGKSVSDNTWYDWFRVNPVRHYRRMFAEHFLSDSLTELKNTANDALTSVVDFDYTIKGKKSEVAEEDGD